MFFIGVVPPKQYRLVCDSGIIACAARQIKGSAELNQKRIGVQCDLFLQGSYSEVQVLKEPIQGINAI